MDIGWNILLEMVALVLSVATAVAVDRMTERRGLTPPGLAVPWRRATVVTLLAAVFWLGVYSPVTTFGAEPPDPSTFTIPQLFLMHAILATVLVVWLVLSFAGTGDGSGSAAAAADGSALVRALARAAEQLGLRAASLWQELSLGVLAGGVGWLATLLLMASVAALYAAVAGSEALPQEVPRVIVWTAGLPVVVRVAIALSAGLVEEAFFRGLLQPRIGIGASSVLFVLAHAGYGAPLMLVALTFLSFFLAQLVRWRQNIWPAVAAHAFFDLVQLLVIIPWALEMTGAGP